MRVLGYTTEHTVYAFGEKAFLIDEYFKIVDEGNGNPIAVVEESYRFDKIKDASPEIQCYLNDTIEGIETRVDISVAKLKIIEELTFPILPGAQIVRPSFDEIKKLLIYGKVDEHFILGTIKGTEETFDNVSEPFNDLFMNYNSKSNRLEKQVGIPFIMNHYKFREYPHIGIFGSSGSGKSYAMRVFCEEMLKKRIPGVILDPHYEMTFGEKTEGLENRFFEDFSEAYETFTVGEDVGINFTELNAEELNTLLRFLTNVSDTAYSIIEAVFQQGDTFAKFFSTLESLKEAFDFYEKKNNSWDKSELSNDVVVIYERYKKKVPNATALQALIWRLSQLKSVGIFTKDISRIEDTIVNRKMAVIRGRDIHVKMLTEYMVKKLYKKRRDYRDWEEKYRNTVDSNNISHNKPAKFPPFFFLTDEAHNYAPDERYSVTPLSLQLVQISQEARKYGVFLVLATQRPASLNSTLFAQLNTKIVFRLTSKLDISTVKTETNLSDIQSLRLPNMTSGNAFVSSPLLNETTYIRFRSAITSAPNALNPFDELSDFEDGSQLRNELMLHLPLKIEDLSLIHNKINKNVGKKVGIKDIKTALDTLVRTGKIIKEESLFGEEYLPLR